MVNIVEAVSGGHLRYGTVMENDQVLQDWLDNRHRKLDHYMSKTFLVESNTFAPYQGLPSGTLLENVEVVQTSVDNLSVCIESLPRREGSFQISELISKEMNVDKNKRLLGLALSHTCGKPLRYCIQHEIVPSVNYWNFQASRFDFTSIRKDTVNAAAIFVESSNSIRDVCHVISPLIAAGINVILFPSSSSVITCLVLTEIINKCAGGEMICQVYISGSSEGLKEIFSNSHVDVIVCGSYAKVRELYDVTDYLRLVADGKNGIAILESGDCDAAVDAAVCSLKTASCLSPGSYLFVQDSLLEDVSWRLRERFAECRTGHLLNSMTDICDHVQFSVGKQVSDYLESTNLEVLRVGNARVVFKAQPSLPLAQWSNIGQTLLVISYRTVNELVNIIGNISDLTELSLWVDQQSTALQVVDHVQVARISVNGFAVCEPGFDHVVQIKQGSVFKSSRSAVPNAVLYTQVDSLRSAQRNWAAQCNKQQVLATLVKKLLADTLFSSMSDDLVKLGEVIRADVKGQVLPNTSKGTMSLHLKDPLGVLAVVASNQIEHMLTFIQLITVSLLRGNAIALAVDMERNPLVQQFVRIAKESGVGNLLFVCIDNTANLRALLRHHAVCKWIVVGDSALPDVQEITDGCGSYIRCVWKIQDLKNLTLQNLCRHVTLNKWVWMAIADGLGC